MPEEEHYWYFNEYWHINKVGYIGTEKEAVRQARKDYLIIFQANAQDLIEAGLY